MLKFVIGSSLGLATGLLISNQFQKNLARKRPRSSYEIITDELERIDRNSALDQYRNIFISLLSSIAIKQKVESAPFESIIQGLEEYKRASPVSSFNVDVLVKVVKSKQQSFSD